MTDFEKLGVFYLGAEYDLETGQRKERLLLYDSKDLVTHAVCVGMTGSGKTGLGICLLEEAAIDGIPCIIIDPKGDLTNLMLSFPDLKPDDFLPWISEGEARDKGLTREQFASRRADLWRNGLQEWGQDGDRIQRLRDSAEFAVYTPGSSAGTPVSILHSFSVPDSRVIDDLELLRERIQSTVSSILGLLGVEADPLRSREHILLSTIFERSWRERRNLDIPGLIQQIQDPQTERIGVMNLEAFYPAKDRFELAMMLNNLLAAPGFELWMSGEPLDIGRMLHTANGKPRVSIFSIAHLNDSERMFFVSLLFTQFLGWVRMQPGTDSLRAILYMDEIFGYFPPVANPPSKEPLLVLLKQARAFGVGIVLATQNPVDLDYKGLSNAGTWFIGRLQTERDRERLLDGLETLGGAVRRTEVGRILSTLNSRVFFMNNVHEEGPVVFESRWALSYLAGPLTREQIHRLPKPEANVSSPAVEETQPVDRIPHSAAASQQRPVLPPHVPEAFLPVHRPESIDAKLLYVPGLLAFGKIFYADAKVGIALQQEIIRLAMFHDDNISWDSSTEIAITDSELEKLPEVDASFQDVPEIAIQSKSYNVWKKSFSDWMFHDHRLVLMKSENLQQFSQPNESEQSFRIRLQQASRENRDRLVERIRQKYARRIESLQEKIRRAEVTVEREQHQATQQKVQTAISFGATVLGALFGRKRVSVSTLGRATTAARGVGRSMKESQDIERARENVTALHQQLKDLEGRLLEETHELQDRLDPMKEVLTEVEIRPKKSGISVSQITLAWIPHWLDDEGKLHPAF